MLYKIFAQSRENTVGRYVITHKKGGKSVGDVTTEKRLPTEKDFQDHLSGKCGLGLSPIMQDGFCYWAAIDVDVYPFDIVSFSKKFASIPIFPCKTKSGGVHIYLFFKRKKPANKVREFLTELAYLLGFFSFEVFPKQENITEDKQANWINLPYFNITERCCVLDGKELTLEEFEKAIVKIDSFKKLLAKFQFSGAPGCILKLQAQEIVPGYRDIALLNIGIFFKNKFEDWKKRLSDYNNLLTNPLTEGELEGNIINQLDKKDLFYQCSTELKDYCPDPNNCPAKDKGFFNEIKFGNKIIKLDTRPAVWKVEINGQLIRLSSTDLLDLSRFRIIVLEYLNILLPRIKNETWEKIIRERLENIEIEQAPIDASIDSDFYHYLKDFCIRFSNSRSDVDVLNGKVIIEKDRNLFKSESFKNYLRKKGLSSYKGNKCFELIKEIGGGSKVKTINKESERLWFVPVYREQIEKKQDYGIPDFSKYDNKEEF